MKTLIAKSQYKPENNPNRKYFIAIFYSSPFCLKNLHHLKSIHVISTSFQNLYRLKNSLKKWKLLLPNQSRGISKLSISCPKVVPFLEVENWFWFVEMCPNPKPKYVFKSLMSTTKSSGAKNLCLVSSLMLSVTGSFLVTCYATQYPGMSVRSSRPSVDFWPHCFCQSAEVTLNTAPVTFSSCLLYPSPIDQNVERFILWPALSCQNHTKRP